MKGYRKNFKKIVWGFIEVEANNEEEAEKLFDEGEYNEFDNKSDYDFEEWKKD